jgi:hypothetical protein
MTEEAWVTVAVGVLGLISTLLAFRMGRHAARQDQRRQAKGVLETVRRDVTRGMEYAEAWRRTARTPAYKLPVATWNSSATLLAAAQALTANQAEALARFFDIANELNDCFGRLVEADPEIRSAEAARALNMVSHLLDIEAPNRESVATRARFAAEEAVAGRRSALSRARRSR